MDMTATSSATQGVSVERQQEAKEIAKELKQTRGEREVYLEDSDSERNRLGDNDKQLAQAIADELGEKIYVNNCWDGIFHIYTFQDLVEDFFAYMGYCKDEEDDYGNLSLADYVDYYFFVFNPQKD